MATQLYFTASSPSAVSPTPHASWGRTTDVLYRELADTKGSSALADGTLISIPAFTATLERSYVSTRMASGITFNTGTAVTLYVQVKKVGASALVQFVEASIRIVSEDGSTVRLETGVSTDSSSEYSTSMTSRRVLNADLVFSSNYTTVAGDRLVIELGHYDGTGGSGTTASSRWGENGTDLSSVGDTSSSVNGWIEFSNTITFLGETAGSSSVSPSVSPSSSVSASPSPSSAPASYIFYRRRR